MSALGALIGFVLTVCSVAVYLLLGGWMGL